MKTVEYPYYLESAEKWAEFCAYSDDEDTSRGDEMAIQDVTGGRLFFVNVYEIDRCYGGPEEGGWWFDAGYAKETRAVGTLDEARAAYRNLLAAWPDEDGPGVSSVIYSGGNYNVCVERHPARDYPEARPHYE